MIPTCQGPDPDTRKPELIAPPGACDTHAHVFGPESKYPYPEERGYTPPDCPLEDYLRMMDTIGFERAVLVHPSVYGPDNTPTLDAIAEMGDRFRGIAVVRSDITDRELEDLHERGMRGVRMTTFVKGGTGVEHIETLAHRIKDLGWLVELHLGNIDELVELAPRLRTLPIPYLIDHFGRIRGGQGVGNPGFQALLRLLNEDETCWVKLCSYYRLSDAGPPDYADMTPPAKALIEACPDRIVWGSNWPHVSFEGPMPNDGDLLDLLLEWAPEAATRRAILADNPARLFGFD